MTQVKKLFAPCQRIFKLLIDVKSTASGSNNLNLSSIHIVEKLQEPTGIFQVLYFI